MTTKHRVSQQLLRRHQMHGGGEWGKRAEPQRDRLSDSSRYLLFDHHDSVMMHATSVTATTRMLSVSSDSSVTHGHVSAHRPSLLQPCYLFYKRTRLVDQRLPRTDSLTIFSLPIDLIIIKLLTKTDVKINNFLYLLI